MNFHQLHIFNVVAKHHSYSKAASELYLSQPTVSVHLQKLELDLGMELFEQFGRNIHLTEAGQTLYQYTQQIFSLAEQAKRALEELNGLHKGRIRLGTSSTPGIYFLPKFIRKFKEEYPGAELQLEVGNSTEIEKKVRSNDIDLSIIGSHTPPEGDLVYEPLWSDHLVLIMQPNHPLLQKEEITLDDLSRQKFVLRESSSSTRRAIDEAFARQGIQLRVSMEYSCTEGIKNAVAANLGISIVSQHAVRLFEQTSYLKVREVPQIKINHDFYLAYHKDKHLAPLTQSLIDSLQAYTAYATSNTERRLS